MTEWFADSYYFLALRNARDEGHKKAVEITDQVKQKRLVTSEWVLTEVGDALSKPANRKGFSDLLVMLMSNPKVVVVEATHSLFEKGVTLFENRPDKGWSVTDCISFEIMSKRSIVEALTADHHFEQAGFVCLLK